MSIVQILKKTVATNAPGPQFSTEAGLSAGSFCVDIGFAPAFDFTAARLDVNKCGPRRAESMQANKDMLNGVVGGPAGKRCRGRPLCDYLAMFVILFASGLGLDPWRYPCSPEISCL